MPQLLVHDRARQDIADITNHIARDNLDAAIRVHDAIAGACELLASMPGAGSRCGLPESALADLRFWPIKRYRQYLVIYRAKDDGAEVIRVIHAARDFGRVLRE